MLKRLFSLIFAAAIVYAGWHTGQALLQYYQFKDGIGQLALFAGNSTEDQIKERVLQLAQQYDVPIDPETVTVKTDSEVTQITAPYTVNVRLLPNYTYEWKLEPAASVVHLH